MVYKTVAHGKTARKKLLSNTISIM